MYNISDPFNTVHIMEYIHNNIVLAMPIILNSGTYSFRASLRVNTSPVSVVILMSS